MSANSVMREPAGRIGRSRRHPAKISHAAPTPLRSSATLKSIENSHILYGLILIQLHLVFPVSTHDNPTRFIAPFSHFKWKYES